MAEKLTPAQSMAVHNRGGKLLVSAAAGSGKTKVLVDRLMDYLQNPQNPAHLDEFLIITYTKAAAMEHVDADTAMARAQKVEMIQSEIMDEYNASVMGKTMEVLVDGYDEEFEQFYGRTFADSPEIDGRIAQEPLHEGEFVQVTMDGTQDGDLTGYVAEEAGE